MNTISKIILLISIGFISTPLYSQMSCKLMLKENKLIGKCEHEVFTDLEIELDKKYNKIDSLALFKMLPTDGFLTIQQKHKLEVSFVITERAGYPQIMFKPKSAPRVGWYTFDDLKIQNNAITFNLDLDPEVPIALEDFKILKEAKKLLKDASHWNKKDDRACEDDKEKGIYSFFCALQTASIKVVGEYNHRNAVMQLMRHLIVKRFPEKKWDHRFEDFNNMQETTFSDILEIIDEAEVIINAALKDKQ